MKKFQNELFVCILYIYIFDIFMIRIYQGIFSISKFEKINKEIIKNKYTGW